MTPKETAATEEAKPFSKLSLSKVVNSIQEEHRATTPKLVIGLPTAPKQLEGYLGFSLSGGKRASFSTRWKTLKQDARSDYIRILQDGHPESKSAAFEGSQPQPTGLPVQAPK